MSFRKKVVGEDALRPLLAAVDGEGNALVEEGEVGGMLAAVQLFARYLVQALVERLVLRAALAVCAEHLVVRRFGRESHVERVGWHGSANGDKGNVMLINRRSKSKLIIFMR
jgi:hypothetical protein